MVMALFSILMILGLFMTSDTLRSAFARSDKAVVVSFLDHARSRSLGNISQSSWGVCYVAPDYIVFKGTLCQTSAAVESAPASLSVAQESNFSDTFPTIVFTQLSATATPSTIAFVQDGRATAITINYEGAIIW